MPFTSTLIIYLLRLDIIYDNISSCLSHRQSNRTGNSNKELDHNDC